MQKQKLFLGWLTEADGIALPLVAWGVLILLIATIDFGLIKTGLGDYEGIDKSSDFALWYNLVFNSIAVSSNLGGPFSPSGWTLLTVAIQDPLGLLFYGVTIAKLVNRSQERMLDEISHKVHLMLNEEDWDSLLDALRARSWKLKNTGLDDHARMSVFKEMVSYVHLLLQQRPYSYKDNVINLYEYEVILRYTLIGLQGMDPCAKQPGISGLANNLCTTLRMYHTGLKINGFALVDDPDINDLFQTVEDKCAELA